MAEKRSEGSVMTENIEREYMGWDALDDCTRSLVASMREQEWKPTLVVAVARGGMAPAAAISYAYDIKNVCMINIKYYDDEAGVGKRLVMPIVLPPIPTLDGLSDQRILIVDDVADTGETLVYARDFFATRRENIRIATCYYKPWSICVPDFYWKTTEKWIMFPWSSYTETK